jgi:hypothetical protein
MAVHQKGTRYQPGDIATAGMGKVKPFIIDLTTVVIVLPFFREYDFPTPHELIILRYME